MTSSLVKSCVDIGNLNTCSSGRVGAWGDWTVKERDAEKARKATDGGDEVREGRACEAGGA